MSERTFWAWVFFMAAMLAPMPLAAKETSVIPSLRVFDRLPNASFEVGLGPWRTSDLYGGGVTSSRSQDAVVGRWSLELHWSDPAAAAWLDSPALHLPEGAALALSFWVRADPDLVGKPLEVQLTGPGWRGQVQQSYAFKLPASWTRLTWRLDPLKSSSAPPRFRLRLPGEGWLRLDGMTLVNRTAGESLTRKGVTAAASWREGTPLFYPGEPAHLELRVAGLTGDAAKPVLEGWIKDDQDQRHALPRAQWTYDDDLAQAILTFQTRRIGRYELTLTLRDDHGRELWTARHAYAVIHRPQLGHHYFGAFAESHSFGKVAAQMAKTGIDQVRFGAAQAWHVITRQGTQPPKPFKGIEHILNQYGIKAIVSLQGAPKSLLHVPKGIGGRRQRLLGMQWNPALRQAWMDYVRQAGKIYPNALAFESWNETNAAGYFLGSTATVADMLRANRQALTDAGVEATPVLGPVVSHLRVPYLRSVFAHGGLDAVDGVSIHPYRTGPGRPEATGYLEELDALNAALADYGKPDAQVWITEMGWTHSDLPHPPKVRGAAIQRSERQVANYIERAFVMGLSRGVDKQFYFKWRDGSDLGRMMFFGLTQPDHLLSPKQGLVAMNTLAALLDTSRFDRALAEKRPFFAYRFVRRDEQVIAAWSSRGRLSVRLSRTDHVTLLDRFGRPEPTGETLVLDESPVFLIAPRNQTLTLTPRIELVENPVILVRGRSTPWTLRPTERVEKVTAVTSTGGKGLEPIDVTEFEPASRDLRVRVKPRPEAQLSFGWMQLNVQADGEAIYLPVPVKIASAGPAPSPLKLGVKREDWSTLSATGKESLDMVEPGHVRFAVRGSKDFYKAQWGVLRVAVPRPDVSRYDAIHFEIKVLEPTDDLFLRVQLRTIDGDKFQTWHEPDVLAKKQGWAPVTIPLRDFAVSGMFSDYNLKAIPPLGKIQSVMLVLGGADPQAHAQIEVRDVELATVSNY